MREYRETKKGRKILKNSDLKRNFGITVEEYDKLFEQQGGLCAICGKPEIARNQYGIRSLAVDHNHKTGEIRGLLCSYCNMKLGILENVEFVVKAVKYLGVS